MINPIKRNEALKPLSRDHHQGLLVCWKIKQGFKLNVETKRIKKYLDWFWKNHLKEHFEIEEKFLFPILGNQNKLIDQAITEHIKLKRLFKNKTEIEKSINLIREELEKHIRFEERTLFNEIQKIATSEELEKIYLTHSSNFKDNWKNEFWVA